MMPMATCGQCSRPALLLVIFGDRPNSPTANGTLFPSAVGTWQSQKAGLKFVSVPCTRLAALESALRQAVQTGRLTAYAGRMHGDSPKAVTIMPPPPVQTPATDTLTTFSALDVTCVPAQSSRDHGPPISTTRTVSPYFSPKSAIAPSDFAWARGISLVTTSRLSRMARGRPGSDASR